MLYKKYFYLPFLTGFIIAMLIDSSELWAQNSISPYSRYGIGELQSTGHAVQQSMGGTAIASQSDTTAFLVNVGNPASYSSWRFIVIEGGATGQLTKLQVGDQKRTLNTINPSYIALGIPIIPKKWGVAVGLLPYSSSGSYFIENLSDPIIGGYYKHYAAYGGVNKLYAGSGVKLAKPLSVGFNASYLFGNIQHDRRIIFSPNYFAYNFKDLQTTYLKGISIDYGLQWNFLRLDSTQVVDSNFVKKIKDDATISDARKTIILKDSLRYRTKERKFPLSFNLGLAGGIGTNIKTSSDILATNYYLDRDYIERTTDTVNYVAGQLGTLKLPSYYGLGLSVKSGDKLTVNMDYMMQDWSKFNFLGDQTHYRNTSRVAIGAQYIPNRNVKFSNNNAVSSYLQLVNYRIGARYNNTYIQIQNSPLDEYAFSFGLGLPVNFKIADPHFVEYGMINVGMEAGIRKTPNSLLIRENFFRLYLGIVLNQKWFIPNKYY